MFSFFKNQNQPKNYGTFSAYGMEDVYQFISENRIKEKIKELKSKPTLGTSFEDFISEESVKSPSGELYFFIRILWYFPNELDLAIYLYNKSKDFSEYDYPKKKSLKDLWKNHLKTMDRMIIHSPEHKDNWISDKRPVYWIEYDMLYVEILKNLVFNFNLQKFSKLQIVGEFKRKGSKINTPEIEIVYRSKSKPKIGYYLIFKSESLLMDIKIDLIEIRENTYKFDTLVGSFQIELQKSEVKISEHKSFSTDEINLLNTINFNEVIKELILNYIGNFDKISKRYSNEVMKPDINFFFFEVLKLNEISDEIKSTIEDRIVSYEPLWGKFDEHYKFK